MNFRPVVLVPVLLLLASPFAPAPVPGELGRSASTYEVVFLVLNRSSGAAVPGASVVFDGSSQGYTDTQGELASVGTYANGTYDLNVSAPGYFTNDSRATVAGPTDVTVWLNTTYTGPPAAGTCEGSYYPQGASFSIDQTPVVGSDNGQGGVSFDVPCPSGTDRWKLSYEGSTVLGGMVVPPAGVDWAHFTGVNGSAPSLESLLISDAPEIVVGFAIGLVVVAACLRSLRGRRTSPLLGAGDAGKGAESLSDPDRAEPHGQPAGDPATEAGPRDPRP